MPTKVTGLKKLRIISHKHRTWTYTAQMTFIK